MGLNERDRGRSERLGVPEGLIFAPDQDSPPTAQELFYPGAARYFDLTSYGINAAILDKIASLFRLLDSRCRTGLYLKFRRYAYPSLTVRPEQAFSLIQRLDHSQPVEETLSRLVGAEVGFPLVPSGLEVRSFFSNILATADSERRVVCPISATHLNDLYLLEEAIEGFGINSRQIGILIMDQHLDINPRSLPDIKKAYTKSGFIHKLLDLGVNIAVIGLLDDDIVQNTQAKVGTKSATTISGLFGGMEGQGKPIYDGRLYEADRCIGVSRLYQQYQDQLCIPQGVLSSSGQTDERRITRTLEKVMDFFRQRSIKYLLCSCDIDSLDQVKEGVTATPYNIHAKIIALGVQDFRRILAEEGIHDTVLLGRQISQEDVFVRQVRELMMLPKLRKEFRKAIKKGFGMSNAKKYEMSRQYRVAIDLLNIMEQIADKCISSICYLNYPIPAIPEEISEEMKLTGISSGMHGGFSVGQVVYLIAQLKRLCQSNNIFFGLPIGQGRLKGSISEVKGLDLFGNTAKAVVKIGTELLY